MWCWNTHPYVRTLSTRMTTKGHCRVHQCLACGGSGGWGGGGGGGEGWCFSICAARGRPGPRGLPPAQANGRINEKGRQAI